MTFRPPALAIALAFLAAQAVAGTADSGYRLAGVIEAGGGRSVAILALPAGGQVLIQKGSVVDGGTVTELSRRGVEITFPDHVLDLTLTGQLGGPIASPHAAPSSRVAAAGASNRARPGSKPSPPPPPSMPPAVSRSISPMEARLFVVNGVAGAPSSTDAKQYIDAEIVQALDLPDHSRIVDVNGESADSADQTVGELQQALTTGNAVVTLDTPQGAQRVYISTAPGPPPAPSAR